jgi:pyridoxine 5-phosphate synthase
VELSRASVRSRLNLEMAATAEMEAIALRIRPDMVTLVPEKRQEVTTEGVWMWSASWKRSAAWWAGSRTPASRVSLFVDAEQGQLKACPAQRRLRWVELHTGFVTPRPAGRPNPWNWHASPRAASSPGSLGLRVNAGHGLTYQNVEPVAAIEGMEELDIGDTIVARGLAVGLEAAVRQMKALVPESPPRSPFRQHHPTSEPAATSYHFVAASEAFLTVEEPLEEVLRERVRNYQEQGKTIDFWLVKRPAFLEAPELASVAGRVPVRRRQWRPLTPSSLPS